MVGAGAPCVRGRNIAFEEITAFLLQCFQRLFDGLFLVFTGSQSIHIQKGGNGLCISASGFHNALAQNSLAQKEFSYLLSGAITAAGGRNEKAICALLDKESLQSSENQVRAIEEALETLKRDSRYLFEGDVPPPYARGTGAYSGAEDKRPTTLAGALREKFERK